MTFNMLFVALVALVPLASAQKMGWKDSYSINGKCYCDTTFDHDIGGIMVDGPNGQITVREACALAGSGPEGDRVYYNDVQCGNGPANNAGDEDSCPGRVDLGDGNRSGCQVKGPKWDLGGSTEPEEPTPPPPSPVVQDLNLQQEDTEYDEIADEPAEVDSVDSDTADPPVIDDSNKTDEFSEGPDEAFFEQADTTASGSMITGLVVTNSADGSASPFSGIIVIDNYPAGFGIRAEVSDSSLVKSVNFKDSSGQERTEFNENYDMFGSTGSWPNPPAGGVVVLTVTATMTDGESETIEANVEFV